MTTTGTIAKALRKNTIWPTGATSPSWRTNADIAANSNAEINLRPIALRGYMGRVGDSPYITTIAGNIPANMQNVRVYFPGAEPPAAGSDLT